jgi:hypothetical protein
MVFIVLPEIAALTLRRQPQIRPCLLARLDPRADQYLQCLRLLQRIDRVVADPDELEVGLFQMDLDDLVERGLDPRFQRHEPFLRRLHPQGLGGRAIDLADERGGGDGESVTDDPREPFVVLILQRRLVRLDQLEVGGHEFEHMAAREIAGHQRVEIVL